MFLLIGWLTGGSLGKNLDQESLKNESSDDEGAMGDHDDEVEACSAVRKR